MIFSSREDKFGSSGDFDQSSGEKVIFSSRAGEKTFAQIILINSCCSQLQGKRKKFA